MVAQIADRLTLDEELSRRVREEAERRGVDAAELVRELLDRQLDENARYVAAVDDGFGAGEREGWLDWEGVKAKREEGIARIRAEHGR